jgi:spoIIIJ-associated protein
MEAQPMETEGIDPETLAPEHQIALEIMNNICATLEQNASAVVRDIQGSYVYIEIVGDDMRATWGRFGAGLDALQQLVNTIVSRHVRSDVRIMLDAGGYRERRAETLRQRAVELAEEVKSVNQEAEFEPMPPHERRIIHSALADDPDIRTYSEGEGNDRRIVISPR